MGTTPFSARSPHDPVVVDVDDPDDDPRPGRAESAGRGSGGRESGGRSESGRSESTAGAWAAAAVVLALGALGFGVVAQFRADDLEERLHQMERSAVTVVSTEAPSSTRPAPPATLSPTLSSAGAPSGSGEPSDQAADREAVQRAFETVYDGSLPGGDRLNLIDDPTGVEIAVGSLATGELGPLAATFRARVDSVTFDNGGGATVRYEVVVGGETKLLDRTGTARRVGSAWKVTRATVCTDLSALGADCGG